MNKLLIGLLALGSLSLSAHDIPKNTAITVSCQSEVLAKCNLNSFSYDISEKTFRIKGGDIECDKSEFNKTIAPALYEKSSNGDIYSYSSNSFMQVGHLRAYPDRTFHFFGKRRVSYANEKPADYSLSFGTNEDGSVNFREVTPVTECEYVGNDLIGFEAAR